MRFEDLKAEEQQSIIDYITMKYPDEKDATTMLAYVKLRMDLLELKDLYNKMPWYKRCFKKAQGVHYLIIEYLFPNW